MLKDGIVGRGQKSKTWEPGGVQRLLLKLLFSFMF